MRQQRVAMLTLLPFAALLAFGTAQAADLSGTYTSTQVITADSRLTGDVTCNISVPGPGPCIQFGAPDVELHLNGHIITGSNASRNVCSGGSVTGDDAIDTNGMDYAQIIGPGLITNFLGVGIIVSGNNSTVKLVVLTSICQDGIRVSGGNNQIRSNSISRFSMGLGFAGIAVGGTGSHTIARNDITGGGALILASGPRQSCGTPFVLCDYVTDTAFGIFVGSSGNDLHGNNASGHVTGLLLKCSCPGNNIHDNQFIGNETDIFDDSGGGATYTNNVCQVDVGLGVCPSLATRVIGRR